MTAPTPPPGRRDLMAALEESLQKATADRARIKAEKAPTPPQWLVEATHLDPTLAYEDHDLTRTEQVWAALLARLDSVTPRQPGMPSRDGWNAALAAVRAALESDDQ